ncbi:MAG: HAD family hydrolase [Dehalococcoidales bacterium]|nr:HAD family hydrolase [Dehalococcoidales bacterium]
MIEVTIPGRQGYRLDYLVLDLNGTITLDGSVISGVRERLAALGKRLEIYVVTADTLGGAQAIAKNLGVKIHKVEPGTEQSQKLRFIEQLGRERVVAIGNGSNDVAMLRESGLGICVIGPEGAAWETIANSDLVTTGINEALDLILKPARLIASLRK